jgi:hypothetical protein
MFTVCAIDQAAVSNPKPPAAELPKFLTSVLWVMSHIQTFLRGGNRPKTQAKPRKTPGRQTKTPDPPMTEAEALACLNHMLQAIQDYMVAHRDGTLPPDDGLEDELENELKDELEDEPAYAAAPPPCPEAQPADAAAVIEPPTAGTESIPALALHPLATQLAPPPPRHAPKPPSQPRGEPPASSSAAAHRPAPNFLQRGFNSEMHSE